MSNIIANSEKEVSCPNLLLMNLSNNFITVFIHRYFNGIPPQKRKELSEPGVGYCRVPRHHRSDPIHDSLQLLLVRAARLRHEWATCTWAEFHNDRPSLAGVLGILEKWHTVPTYRLSEVTAENLGYTYSRTKWIMYQGGTFVEPMLYCHTWAQNKNTWEISIFFKLPVRSILIYGPGRIYDLCIMIKINCKYFSWVHDVAIYQGITNLTLSTSTSGLYLFVSLVLYSQIPSNHNSESSRCHSSSSILTHQP